MIHAAAELVRQRGSPARQDIWAAGLRLRSGNCRVKSRPDGSRAMPSPAIPRDSCFSQTGRPLGLFVRCLASAGLQAAVMTGEFYRSFSTEIISATDSSNDSAAA